MGVSGGSGGRDGGAIVPPVVRQKQAELLKVDDGNKLPAAAFGCACEGALFNEKIVRVSGGQ